MYHIKHERVYVSYKPLKASNGCLFHYIFIWYSHKVNIRRPVISVLQCIFPPIIIAARDKAETQVEGSRHPQSGRKIKRYRYCGLTKGEKADLKNIKVQELSLVILVRNYTKSDFQVMIIVAHHCIYYIIPNFRIFRRFNGEMDCPSNILFIVPMKSIQRSISVLHGRFYMNYIMKNVNTRRYPCHYINPLNHQRLKKTGTCLLKSSDKHVSLIVSITRANQKLMLMNDR